MRLFQPTDLESAQFHMEPVFSCAATTHYLLLKLLQFFQISHKEMQGNQSYENDTY